MRPFTFRFLTQSVAVAVLGLIFTPSAYASTGNAVVCPYPYLCIGVAPGSAGTASVTDTSSAIAFGNGALASDDGWASGNGAHATGGVSVALGNSATATGEKSVAIGSYDGGLIGGSAGSASSGLHSTAINGTALSNNSIAINGSAGYGPDPTQNTGAITLGGYSFGTNSLSAGTGSRANGVGDTAIGSLASANPSNIGLSGATAVGTLATADSMNATALGFGAKATGDSASALGSGSNASGASSVAAGGLASGVSSVAVGHGIASGLNAITLGVGNATADYSMAFGANAGVASSGIGSIAFAPLAQPGPLGGGVPPVTRAGVFDIGGRQISSIAAGVSADDAVNVQQLNDAIAGISAGSVPWIASTDAATAAVALGRDGTALGAGAQAGNSETQGNVAIGAGAQAGTVGSSTGTTIDTMGGQSVAIGAGAKVTAIGGNALGFGAQSTAPFADAYGSGSLADETGTASFGNSLTGATRRLVNIAPGINASDAATVGQLTPIAGVLGGGAGVSGGYFTPPSYLLSGETFGNVGDALTFLDGRINAGGGTGNAPVGPQGPKGDKGDVGPQGPAGTGTGTDSLAVHYDDGTEASATLGGSNGTTLKNVAAGTVGTDAANVSQVQAAVQQSQTYTDNSVAAAKDWSKAYTDRRFSQASRQAAQAGAVGSAIGMLALGAQGVEQHDRLAMSVAGYKGQSAIGLGYNHVTESGRISIAIGGAFAAGGSAIGVSVGIGLGR